MRAPIEKGEGSTDSSVGRGSDNIARSRALFSPGGAVLCPEQDTSSRLLSTEKIDDRDVKPQTKQNKQGKKANTSSMKRRMLSVAIRIFSVNTPSVYCTFLSL